MYNNNGGRSGSFSGGSSRGGSSFGTRPPSRGGFRPQGGGRRGASRFGEYIDPAKFIAKAQPREEQEVFVPTFKFGDLEISQTLKDNILKKGYNTPTPVQDKCIPSIMLGEDVLGMANTGTGKTAAFLIPLINKAIKNPNEKVLIIVPTRELAEQINDELYELTRNLRVFSVKCIGGDDISRQIQNLRRGFNFVVGTPGRLKDLAERRLLSFESFTTIVLDEVDRMLDMGFVDEIKAIIAKLPENKQSLFFSATINKKVEDLIKLILKHSFVRVSVTTGETSKNIDQDVVHYMDHTDRLTQIEGLLKTHNPKRILIFVNTKREVDKLDSYLFDKGYAVEAIHGDKRQNFRKRAIDKFKTGRANILIATDVAARGLDIKDVALVINYDVPNNHDDYVHRIGRTGRADAMGKALTFVKKDLIISERPRDSFQRTSRPSFSYGKRKYSR